jgi:hypothetical protein
MKLILKCGEVYRVNVAETSPFCATSSVRRRADQTRVITGQCVALCDESIAGGAIWNVRTCVRNVVHVFASQRVN